MTIRLTCSLVVAHRFIGGAGDVFEDAELGAAVRTALLDGKAADEVTEDAAAIAPPAAEPVARRKPKGPPEDKAGSGGE